MGELGSTGESSNAWVVGKTENEILNTSDCCAVPVLFSRGYAGIDRLCGAAQG